MTDSQPDETKARRESIHKNAKRRARKKTTARKKSRPSTQKKKPEPVSGDLGQEALMTLIAIMKDDSDPKLQMAAAKVLLDKSRAAFGALEETDTQETVTPGEDDVDAAITLAKKLLDELARSKTQKLDGKGALAAEGAAGTDNA